MQKSLFHLLKFHGDALNKAPSPWVGAFLSAQKMVRRNWLTKDHAVTWPKNFDFQPLSRMWCGRSTCLSRQSTQTMGPSARRGSTIPSIAVRKTPIFYCVALPTHLLTVEVGGNLGPSLKPRLRLSRSLIVVGFRNKIFSRLPLSLLLKAPNA